MDPRAERLTCVVDAADVMRRATSAALTDVPHESSTINVLADLVVESQAAVAVATRLVSEGDTALARIGVPIGCFWVGKRVPMVISEVVSLGIAAESRLPGCPPLELDVHPEVLDAWLTAVGDARGEDRRLDRAVTDVLEELADLRDVEARARRLASRMATTLQGALLVMGDDPAVADAFCASRLGGDWLGTFGTLPRGLDLAGIVRRATPAPDESGARE